MSVLSPCNVLRPVLANFTSANQKNLQNKEETMKTVSMAFLKATINLLVIDSTLIKLHTCFAQFIHCNDSAANIFCRKNS